jgi:glycosyltransferase involved in cell wall biosynthesis
LTVVVPAYNERDSLPELMEALEGFVLLSPFTVQVVIVDDPSTDGTRGILNEESVRRPWLTVLSTSRRSGIGAALRLGTAQAAQPLVAWVMADRCDHLQDLWDMRRRLLDGADLVIASRGADEGSYGDVNALRAWGSWSFSRLAKLVLRLPVSDSTNPFRAFRKEVFDALRLTREDFGLLPEMTFKAHAAGLWLEQVPTDYQNNRRPPARFHTRSRAAAYAQTLATACLARLSGSTRAAGI